MRLVLAVMMALALHGSASAQKTEQTGTAKPKVSAAALKPGTGVEGATPKPKATDGPVTLKPAKPAATDGPVTLKPAKPKPTDGPVTLKPEPEGSRLLPFEQPKPNAPAATLLPFSDQPPEKSAVKNPSAARSEARGKAAVLREVLERDQTASEADAAANERSAIAIRQALDRRDPDRARQLVDALAADIARRKAALDARRRELNQRLAEAASAK